MSVFDEMFEKIEHRIYLRHLYANFKKKFGGGAIGTFDEGCQSYLFSSLGEKDEWAESTEQEHMGMTDGSTYQSMV